MAKKAAQHSKNYDKVKMYYDNYLAGKKPQWDKDRVHAVVGKWITPEEYEEITGEPYVE